MLILALDTSSPVGSLAVLRDDKLLGSVSTWTEESYSSRMFRHLEFLLRELSLSLDRFDLFAVAAGPGSFTGLRVGLAAAKGWAEACQKPIAAVSGLEAVAAQSHSASPLLVPVLDARGGQVYSAFYRCVGTLPERDLALEGEEFAIASGEFLDTLRSRVGNSDFAIVTPAPGVISAAVSRLEMARAPRGQLAIEQVSTALAPAVGQLGYRRALRGKLVDALTLDANYIRRSDAELHWKGT